MRLSQAGLRLIQNFEGLRVQAYQDAGGVWTIGYGHTGPDVLPGLTITAEEASDLLRRDVARFEQGVTSLVRVPVTQPQFDALVSFAFNVGIGAFGKSTLLRRLNEGKVEEAAKEFGRWTHEGGKQLAGLVRRRAAETALFTSAVTPPELTVVFEGRPLDPSLVKMIEGRIYLHVRALEPTYTVVWDAGTRIAEVRIAKA